MVSLIIVTVRSKLWSIIEGTLAHLKKQKAEEDHSLNGE